MPKRLEAMLRIAKKRSGKSIYRSVALDGVRAGGAEWCIYATTDPESGTSHFMPPKAGGAHGSNTGLSLGIRKKTYRTQALHQFSVFFGYGFSARNTYAKIPHGTPTSNFEGVGGLSSLSLYWKHVPAHLALPCPLAPTGSPYPTPAQKQPKARPQGSARVNSEVFFSARGSFAGGKIRTILLNLSFCVLAQTKAH